MAKVQQAQSLPIKYAVIDASGAGDNTVVAAVTGRRIRVLSAFAVGAGAVTVKFQSGAGGTDITGAMSLSANGGFVLPFNEGGWFQTDQGALLNVSLGGAVNVAGGISYIETVGP